MQQRGRKTAAVIAAAMAKPKVIKGGFATAKAQPTEGMTEAQAKIWRETVAGEPNDFFGTAATRAMLADYCRHRQEVDEFSALINAFPPEALQEAKGMRRYEWLIKMRDKASVSATRMATKLRLTNQSRWQPQAAATEAQNAGGEDAPWDEMFRAKKKRKPTRAEDNIDWCEHYLFIPEGKNVGQKLKMATFIKDDFKAIYDNKHGTRRAIISRGRKNAKTFEAACIILLHLCGLEARTRLNSQLFSTALSRDQAALVFNLAVKMVRMNRVLNAVVMVRETAKQMSCPKLGTTYRALSADAGTNFGLSPALVVHDELGQIRGPRSPLYEALETATAAQADPLSVIISTQAPTDADLLSVLIDDAKAGHDPHTVLRLHTADKELDAFSLKAIKQANPALDVFMNRKEVLAMATDAKRMPARQAEYENLVLNRRVETANPFVSHQAWKDCGGEVADLHGVPLYGGLDLSSVADLTALVLIGKIERTWHIKPTFWLPEDGLYEKAQKDKVPYDIWHAKGFLETTPGKTVSYEHVAKLLFGLFNEYNIKKIGFDRWNFKHLKPWLLHAGFDEYVITDHFVEFGQGTQSMSPALRDLEQAIKEKEIAHGNHPVLAMCAACAVVDGKDDANRKLSKNRSTGRIDGMVALAEAIGVAPLDAAAVDIDALIG